MSKEMKLLTPTEQAQRIATWYQRARRWQMGISIAAACLAIAAVYGFALLVAAWLDYMIMPGHAARIVLALCVCVSALIAGVFVLLRAWRQYVAHRALVARMEAHMPGVRHGLATFIDRSSAAHGEEKRFVDELGTRVNALFATTTLRDFITFAPLVKPVALCVVVLATVIIWLAYVPYGFRALGHIVMPWRDAPYTRVVDAQPHSALLPGVRTRFAADVEGRQVRSAYLTLYFEDDVTQTVRIPLSNAVAETYVRGLSRPFSYAFRAGDGVTPRQTVTMIHTPVVTASYAKVTWPGYTRRGVTHESPTDVRLLRGSEVTFHWWFAYDVSAMELREPETQSDDIAIQVDGSHASMTVRPEETISYTLRARDARSEEGYTDLTTHVRVWEDAPPHVHIRHPVHDITVPDDYGFTIEAHITDDIAIRDISFVYQINDQPQRRIPLYRGDDFMSSLVVTHRVDMTELTLRQNDILAYYISARDVRDDASAEGRSRLLFVETTSTSYADDSPENGGARIIDPFPQFVRIYKQIVADAFELLPYTNELERTASRRDNLAGRCNAVAGAAERLHEILIQRAVEAGYEESMVRDHRIARAFRHVTGASHIIATNFVENMLPLSYRQSQQLLSFMLQHRMPQDPGGGGGDDDELSEEEAILQALRLAEREESKKVEDERQRRLARLDDLEQELADLSSKQRGMEDAMDKMQAAEGDEAGEQRGEAQAQADAAAEQVGRMAGRPGADRDALEELQSRLEEVSALLAEGRDEEARAALGEAQELTRGLTQDVMQQRMEEIAEGFRSLGQQLAMAADYQNVVRRTTLHRDEDTDMTDIVPQQRTVEEWWNEIRGHANALHMHTETMAPEFDERVLAFIHELHTSPVSPAMASAIEALEARSATDAVHAQEQARDGLRALAESAHAHLAAFMPDPLEQMARMTREMTTLAEIQKDIASHYAEHMDTMTTHEQAHYAQMQESVARRMETLQAGMAPGMPADVSAAVAEAVGALHDAHSAVEGRRMNVRERTAYAAQQIDTVQEIIQRALRQSAVARLHRLRTDAQALRDRTDRDALQIPAQYSEELTAIARVVQHMDVALLMSVTQTRWDQLKEHDPHAALSYLAEQCARAIAVIELPKIARVESFLYRAMQDRQADASDATLHAAARAAIDAVVEETHTPAIAQLVSSHGAEIDAGVRTTLRDHVRALEPLAEAWLRARISHQQEIIATDESVPAAYTDIVNEYLRVLSYK